MELTSLIAPLFNYFSLCLDCQAKAEGVIGEGDHSSIKDDSNFFQTKFIFFLEVSHIVFKLGFDIVWAMWIGAYLLIKLSLLIFFDGRPLLGGIYTYLLNTEMVLPMISGYVINSMAQMLGKYLRRADLILEQRDLCKVI